jgi:hypothetical protein
MIFSEMPLCAMLFLASFMKIGTGRDIGFSDFVRRPDFS